MTDRPAGYNHVIVHDGRMGRDPARVVAVGDETYGEVLMEYDTDAPLFGGEHLTLPDGTTVVVLGYNETLTEDGATTRAFIGNLP